MKKNFYLLIALLLFAGAVDAQAIILVRDYTQSPADEGVQDSIAPFTVFIGKSDCLFISHEDPNYYKNRSMTPPPLPSDSSKVVIRGENNDIIFNREYHTSQVQLELNHLGIPSGSYTLHFFWDKIWWKGDFVFKSHWPEGEYVHVDSVYYRLSEGYAYTVWPDYFPGKSITYRRGWDWDKPTYRDYPDHLVIPAELTYEGNSYEIVGIEDRSFKWCYYLLSVKLPNTITHIDGGAFMECANLRRINIPPSVTSLGNSVFYGCERLSDIVIPDGITMIEHTTFENCTSLSAITLPGGLTKIGDWAFAGCTSLPWIDIPNEVTSIGDYAFQGCKVLMEVELPKQLKRIGNYAFRGDLLLKSIVIPDGVTYIGTEAFKGCSGLQSVTLPEGMAQIGNEAFTGIPDAAHIYCNAKTPFNISGNTFNFRNTLHVPYGCKEKYEKAAYWKNFTNIEEMDYEKDNEVSSDETGVSPTVWSNGTESAEQFYDLKGRPVDGTLKGIYIQNGKKVLVK